MKTLIIILISAYNIYASDSICFAPKVNDCSFYKNCLENVNECGETGYALGYGEKYCNKFKKYRFSKKRGRIWVARTMMCLQRQLIPVVQLVSTMTCSNIKKLAFGSHAGCYLNPVEKDPSISVCWLPLFDLIRIFKIIDFKDLVARDAIRQEKVVANGCIKRVLRKWYKGNKNRTQEDEDEHIERMNFFEDLARR